MAASARAAAVILNAENLETQPGVNIAAGVLDVDGRRWGGFEEFYLPGCESHGASGQRQRQRPPLACSKDTPKWPGVPEGERQAKKSGWVKESLKERPATSR